MKKNTLLREAGDTWSPIGNADGGPRSSDARARTRVERAAWQAPHPMFLCASDGMLRWVNRAFEALTGYPAATLVGRSTIQALLASSDGARCNASVAQLNGGHWLLNRCPDERRPVQVDVSQVDSRIDSELDSELEPRLDARSSPDTDTRAEPGHTHGACAVDEHVGFLVERADGSQLDGERWYALNFDAAMQLPNRRLFVERLDLRIARARRIRDRFSVVMVALSGLESIRNVLGQPGVEMVSQVIGDRLRARILRTQAFACVGEGKFALVSDEASVDLIDDVVAQACEPVEFVGAHLRVAAHAGIATYPDNGEDTETLMRRTEVALSSARDAGANGVVHFSSALEIRAARRFELEAMLARALERQQCWLAYQPQVTLATGEIAQVEALMRWRHPTHGDISPAEFIPIAEQTGMIDKIGEWVIHTACQEFGKLRRVVRHLPRVCVNVSPQQFERGNLLEVIRDALDRSGLVPECLEIEITEGVLFADTERALTTIRAIRELGIEVAVDDFGTGYSSLSYLTRFPINRVKIDRSFVTPLPGDAGSSELVSAIIAMAHALQMRVTAEGVETVEQAERLRELGCDEAQGFWYSRPHAIASLRTLLGH
ncbi:EAL domain-containing protein [Burkholderia sp. Ac-20353]|uniref:EAL domain-containing protein n=1 Tax=Burkholderia sp. Ac-20353 TaxID=2703894 RepID=UPI00197C6B25|nr:EAL domain-containing protein [Burkholderia sp. Ac-20353]MBN3791073.1 EAL domain-containing protein [Burkholderia sp. Ac-20353]